MKHHFTGAVSPEGAAHRCTQDRRNFSMYGFYRIAVAVPAIVPGDVTYNCNEIIRLCQEAKNAGAAMVCFPHLALTGASCGELFFQSTLLDAARSAAEKIAEAAGNSLLAVFGTPYRQPGMDEAWDIFAVAGNGSVLHRVPAGNFDRRFFCNGNIPEGNNCRRFNCGISVAIQKSLCHGDAPAEVDIFSSGDGALPGVSAELENFAAAASRAAKNVAVVTTGCAGESTAGFASPTKAVIAANGKILAATPLLSEKSELIFADIDMEELKYQRMRSGKTLSIAPMVDMSVPESPELSYAALSKHPYLPEDDAARAAFCQETLEIQSFALAHRMKKAFAQKMVLGISGGLDSTLALVALNRTCEQLKWDKKSIIAVTMPGFGTTGRTRNNALELAKIIGADIREIPISAACMQHFEDIGHDPGIRNAVYENTQARERTQILMDIANKENGLVIGTGDLSEISMGWCTYNGDQMSMYSLNGAIMKTVIPELLKFEITCRPEMGAVLQDIIDTPVSPELLPAENGTPGHCTEEILGAYEIHDFFIWHFINGGAGREKLLALAEIAFAGKYDKAEIERCLGIFLKRFFTQQFKRSASPEGINANAVSLAPAEWQMPSDISGKLWQ